MMKKFSGHKLYKFPTGHTLRSECEYPYKPPMKGGHTHNKIMNMELRLMLSKKEIKELRKIMKKDKYMVMYWMSLPSAPKEEK